MNTYYMLVNKQEILYYDRDIAAVESLSIKYEKPTIYRVDIYEDNSMDIYIIGKDDAKWILIVKNLHKKSLIL